jgi:steroid 5-alpha reductase family enzyme
MNFLPESPLLPTFTAFLIGAAVSVLIMVITWLVQCRTKNAGIVDVVWSFTVTAPVLTVTVGSITRNNWIAPALMLFVHLMWALRLSWYLHSRYKSEVEDARYTALRQEWGASANAKMLRFYLAQTMGSFLLALPLVVIATAPRTAPWIPILFSSAILLSIFLESLADRQLAAFKANPANKGQICRSGLWSRSRHPNYFFEWTIWVWFATWALTSGYIPISLMALIAPAMMYHFLVNVTGVKPTDEHMARTRPEAYADYARTTPAFFPRIL